MVGLLFPHSLPFLLIAIAILALPRRHFLHVVGWLAIPAVLIAVEVGHPPGRHLQNFGYSLGLAILMLAGALIGTAVIIKAAGIALWAKWQGEPVLSAVLGEPWKTSADPRRALIVCWGVLSAFLACLAARSHLAPADDSRPAVLAALAFTASLWLVPWLWAIAAKGLPRSASGRLFLQSFRWSVFAIVALSMAMAWLVTHEARTIAGEDPYCIQVPGIRTTYRQAGTRLDLSGLALKGAGQFHGVLAVADGRGRRIFNWSYRNLTFMEMPGSGRPDQFSPFLSCEPRPEFAAGLSLLREPRAEATLVYFAGRQFRIPHRFRLRLSGVYGRQFSLYAAAPDFQAVDFSADTGPAHLRPYVHVWLGPGPWSRRWGQLDPDERIVSEEEYAGLTMQTIEQAEPYRQNYRYIDRDAEGALRTIIECLRPPSSGRSSCEHTVRHGGMFLSFRHANDALADWRAMQARLFGLFDSFSVDANTGRSPSG